MAVNARLEPTTDTVQKLARLSKADAMPELRAGMRTATSPIVAAVKRAARSLPSGRSRRNTPGGSLRNAVANSVTRRMKLSARTVVITIKAIPKGGKSNLSRCLEGEIPWDHPTFGHKPDVAQEPKPFFYKTIESIEPAVIAKVDAVVSEFERRL